MLTSSLKHACVALVAAILMIPAAASAAQPATVEGTVRTADGAPVASASVVLRGTMTAQTTTDPSGAFHFPTVDAGDYVAVVTKSGFQTYEDDNVVALSGQTTTLQVTLAPISFSSLKTIASVSTTARGRAPINTSTAAVNTISNQVFIEQGATQVTSVLNQTPGIISAITPESGSGASEGSPQVIQIRGALPYETEQLVDGHPTTLTLTGTFDPIYLNPALLQDVELLKGPGSMPAEINYAIGGTVNYITLQPTRTPQETVILGLDNWGGVNTAFRATGSTKTHLIDYAFGYATNGTPGPLKNYPIAGSQVNLVAGVLGPWYINGQQLAEYPESFGPYPPTANYTGIGGIQFTEPMYVCCFGANTAFNSRNELAKVRFNLSQTTSLMVSYLGSQAFNNLTGTDLTSLAPIGTSNTSFSIFSPPPGYTGSVPSGTWIPFDLEAFLPQFQSVQQNLYQAEFRTSIGQYSVLARYFSAADNDFAYIQEPPNGTFAFSGNAWGGVPLCPTNTSFDIITYLTTGTSQCLPASGPPVSPTMTFFNGQNTTFSVANALNSDLAQDHLRGQSLQIMRVLGNGDDYAFSVDQAHHDSTQYIDDETAGPAYFALPPGASQGFMTEALRAHFFLGQRVTLGLASYFTQYSSHYTDDGGTTWHDATRGYVSPRLGLTWQPNVDTSWRFSTGSSIAPPEIGFLSSSGTQPLPNINGAPTYYTENLNNGDIAPETAWGYDLGIDRRFDRSYSFTIDLYLETLRNMFLDATSLAGTYQGLPLYAAETANLGHARYEGIEFGVQNAPIAGWGFRLQGDVERAYAYNLPPYFYCSVPGPGCTQDQNLGILPGVNFPAGGLGFNTVNGNAVPYSMGYAEINNRTHYGTYYRLGTTYYGSNNAFSLPAFFVFNGSIEEPLGNAMSLQLSANNIFGAYPNRWTSYFGGISTALLSGQLGPTVGGNYGPTSFRLQFITNFGNR